MCFYFHYNFKVAKMKHEETRSISTPPWMECLSTEGSPPPPLLLPVLNSPALIYNIAFSLMATWYTDSVNWGELSFSSSTFTSNNTGVLCSSDVHLSEKSHCEGEVVPKNTSQCPQPELEPDPEVSGLTMTPQRLDQHTSC